ncbi:MAG: Uncharacterized protein Greene041619_1169 [Candidatus Peregrinibacteria bacterium Greene0416_19]|nr:MAG: Uncharacterized protein Greene041619_1169 [Candidatus Peregrinibacteria bacterium Greene0416_19]
MEPHINAIAPGASSRTGVVAPLLPLTSNRVCAASTLALAQEIGSQTESFLARFARLKSRVLAKRPILRDILRKRGGETLLEYASKYVDVNLNPPILQRQSECLSVIREASNERYGHDVAESVVAQLEKYYFVSTADHVGPITHPFFVNANLLTALGIRERCNPALQSIIVLACANVSLNNSSFPRGLLFHTCKEGTLRQERLSFLPSNCHSCSVYNFRPYTSAEIRKVEKRLTGLKKEGSVTVPVADRLQSIIHEIYDRPEILACRSYRDQAARTNRALWKRLFEASNVQMPQLLYLDQEDIVVRLLTRYHLDQDTVINHILFDPAYERYVNEYFDGIFGSFSQEDATGTYLFWALPKGAKINQQLWRRGGELITADGSFRVTLNSDALRAAMLSGELIPSLLLTFITICFYYGLKCLGGFNQVNYLTLMKNAYIKMNVDLGNYRSIEVCARAQTKEICDGLTLAFLGYDGGRVALASGLDLILYGNNGSFDTLLRQGKEMTLEEALNPLMPEIYRISYDEKEREADLLSVTEKDINQLTSLDRKVKPCITLPDT